MKGLYLRRSKEVFILPVLAAQSKSGSGQAVFCAVSGMGSIVREKGIMEEIK